MQGVGSIRRKMVNVTQAGQGSRGGMSGHHSAWRGRRSTARGARKPQPGAALSWGVQPRQEDGQTLPAPTLSHAVPPLSHCLASPESRVHTLSPHSSPGSPFPAASETAKLWVPRPSRPSRHKPPPAALSQPAGQASLSLSSATRSGETVK